MEFCKEDPSGFIPSYAKGLSILLVDPDVTSLVYIASMLEQYSFKVATTELASVALTLIIEQKDTYKLVLADVDKPDMDYRSFLRIIVNKGVPVVAVTSERSVEVIGKALAEGASFCLDKPIALEDLKYVWQHVFRKKRRPWIHRVRAKKMVMEDNIDEQTQCWVVITEEGNAPIATDNCTSSKGQGKEIDIIHQEHCRQMELDFLHEDLLMNDQGCSTALYHTGIETPFWGPHQGWLMTTMPTCIGMETLPTPLNQNQGGSMTSMPTCIGMETMPKPLNQNQSGLMTTMPTCIGTETLLIPLSQNQGGLMTTNPTFSTVLHHTGMETLQTPATQTQDGYMGTGLAYSKPSTTKENKGRKISEKDVTMVAERNQSRSSPDNSNKNPTKTRRSPVPWDADLHRKFLSAIGALADEKTRRKTMLEEMKVPGLTINHLACHLQKFKSDVNHIRDNTAGNSSIANDGQYGHCKGSQNSLSDIRGNNVQSFKPPKPALNLPSIDPSVSQTKHGSIYPGIMQKPNSASGQSSSKNVNDVFKRSIGFTGDVTHLIEFWNPVKTPGSTMQTRNDELNPTQAENATSANLQNTEKGASYVGNSVAASNQLSNKQVRNATAINCQRAEKGISDFSNPGAISNHPTDMQVANSTSANVQKLNKNATDVSNPLAIGRADMMNILLEDPANFKGQYHNKVDSNAQEKGVIGLSKSLSTPKNQSQVSPAITSSGPLSFKDKFPVDKVHKNQEKNAPKYTDPLATWYDADEDEYADGWDEIEAEPSRIAVSKTGDKFLSEIVSKNQGPNAVVASANQPTGMSKENEELLANIDWERVLNETMDFEVEFPVEVTNMNMKTDAAAGLNTIANMQNKSRQVGHGHACQSRENEDESDGCKRLPGEPDPEDMDRYCEWLTNFSIE